MTMGAAGSWAGSGMTGMVLDTVTNQVFAVASDEQVAGLTERYTEMGGAKAAFKFLAERIIRFLEQERGVKR